MKHADEDRVIADNTIENPKVTLDESDLSSVSGGTMPEFVTQFKVMLLSSGPHKLQTVKTAVQCLSLSLRASKDLIDSCPCELKGKLAKDEAEMVAGEFRDAGAIVEIRPDM